MKEGIIAIPIGPTSPKSKDGRKPIPRIVINGRDLDRPQVICVITAVNACIESLIKVIEKRPEEKEKEEEILADMLCLRTYFDRH